MFETVEATQYVRLMRVGRNAPLLLECEKADGSVVEVVAKLSTSECGVSGLISEAWAAMLAGDLDLPVPAAFAVVLTPEFVATVPDSAVQNRLIASDTIAFGSQLLTEGYTTWNSAMFIPGLLRESAAEIFCFDALTLNADRLPRNPNCLSNGKRFAIFDHDLSFRGLDVIGSFLQPYPWSHLSLEPLVKADGRHLFAAHLTKSKPLLPSLEVKWAALTSQRYSEYGGAIPPSWTAGNAISDGIEHYLNDLSNNITAGFNEVRRALS